MDAKLKAVYYFLFQWWSDASVLLMVFACGVLCIGFFCCGIYEYKAVRIKKRRNHNWELEVNNLSNKFMYGVFIFIVIYGVFLFIFGTFNNLVLPKWIYPHSNTEFKPRAQKNLAAIYQERFVTQRWVYNAKLVYGTALGSWDETKLTKLQNQILIKQNDISQNNRDLSRLKKLNRKFDWQIKISQMKKLYPKLKDNNVKLKNTQFIDKSLQQEIVEEFK